MTETNVFELTQPGTFSDPLTEVLRNGARTLLGQAVEAEWFKFLSANVVVPFWAWRTPTPPLPGGPRLGRARATMAIAQNVDEIFAGLDNVGTVHFARFVLIGDYLCMISVYDGDFSNYIRDFIATIGSVFDAVVALVEGGEAITPSATHVEQFIDWVHAHDLFQVPDVPADLFALQEAARGGPREGGPDGLRLLSRDLILQLHANPNVSIGGGYRAYPGFSTAQVRRKFGVGW